MTRSSLPRPPLAGVVGCLSLLLIGWSGLLVPSLIRSVKTTFDQSDAGIGTFYFTFAVLYAIGSLSGGLLTERFGRRRVLTLGAGLHGLGLLALGLAPSWPLFLLAGLPAGLGGGIIDGGANGLFLDLFTEGRGRALNLLHLFFSLGALSAPLAVGRFVDAGVAWGVIVTGTGVAGLLLAAAYSVVAMPGGRRDRGPRARQEHGPGWLERSRGRLAAPLLLLALAIACYVAAEIGVSNWLVRFLEPAPLSQATTALAGFWAGLALGRLTSARIADRFDHVRFTVVCAIATAIALAGAVLVPSLQVSIVLFALTGFVTGPIFPMIIVIGGERYPDRSAAVSGFLGGSAVVGSIVYPPIMGFLSVTVGLTVAMLGNVILAGAAAVALLSVRRVDSGRPSFDV